MDTGAGRTWNACGYVRLSREDGDGEESNSVTGQKELIRDYFRRHPELRECGMAVDDGYTGSNFDRPAFRWMMAGVRAGGIDCVVVKDLSRFGRDYLEAGEYIENIFPLLGVRFIAINDRYDSLYSRPEWDDLLIPFKNLINEAYCRDISVKIRSQLEIRRRRGDFVGAFAAFGYRKDPADRHRLRIDDGAAGVVRDIFRWKLEGVSAADIAGRLNGAGVPTPMDYKRAGGMAYSTPFRVKETSAWSAGMVLRILKDPVYVGVLEQGKVTTPSYKVRRSVRRPRGEWAVVADCHEPIIDRWDFETVQEVLALDTRTGAGGGAVALFSGLVFCGECGAAMVRKTVPSGKKKYVYYVCAAHKSGGTCFAHSLRDTALEDIVLTLVGKWTRAAVDLPGLAERAGEAGLRRTGVGALRERLAGKEGEIDRCRRLLASLYESLESGLIDQEEYQELKQVYTRRRARAEEQAGDIREQIGRALADSTDRREWMERLRRGGGIAALDRALVVTLVRRVAVYRRRRVEVCFRWRDELVGRTLSPSALPGKEAD